MGAMPGLEMLIVEGLLLGALAIETIVLLVLAFVVSGSSPVGAKRNLGAFVALPIGIALPSLAGVVTWVWTQREIHAPSAYHSDVDAVSTSTTVLMIVTALSFGAALAYLAVAFARTIRAKSAASSDGIAP